MNLETWVHLWLQPAGFVSSLDSRQLPPACRICRPGVDLPDCLKVPASMHFEEDDMPVQPPPAPVAEAKRKAAPKGKAKAKSSVGNGFRKRCIVCQDPDKPCCEKNPYCKEDKVDVEGLRKDSKKNGWNEKFEHALQNDHALFRRFILDYQETCPKKGRGGSAAAAYSKTRLQRILSTAKVISEATLRSLEAARQAQATLAPGWKQDRSKAKRLVRKDRIAWIHQQLQADPGAVSSTVWNAIRRQRKGFQGRRSHLVTDGKPVPWSKTHEAFRDHLQAKQWAKPNIPDHTANLRRSRPPYDPRKMTSPYLQCKNFQQLSPRLKTVRLRARTD